MITFAIVENLTFSKNVTSFSCISLRIVGWDFWRVICRGCGVIYGTRAAAGRIPFDMMPFAAWCGWQQEIPLFVGVKFVIDVGVKFRRWVGVKFEFDVGVKFIVE